MIGQLPKDLLRKLLQTKPLDSGAEFSKCLRFRYLLWRIWDTSLPVVLVIGLNPSTANATRDDATIWKLIRLTKNWKYGGFYMANCFPHMATNPKNMKPNLRLEKNDYWIKLAAYKCEKVLFAWGNFPIISQTKRDQKMKTYFPKALVIAHNKNGTPKHPLYAPLTSGPIPF